MQFEAIYNKGKLEFLTPVKFKHQIFHLNVDIPEQEIATPNRPVIQNSDTFDRFNLTAEALEIAIKIRMNQFRFESMHEVSSSEENGEDNLSQNQQQYWDAFQLRNDR